MIRFIFISVYFLSGFFLAQDIVFLDDNLKEKLLSLENVNTNFNDEISVEEALNVQVLDLQNVEISDLTGLEYFENLTELYLSNNNLSNINVSVFQNLAFLDCSYNLISTINFSENPLLTYVNLAENMLTELNISSNLELVYLDISGNNISNLNTSNHVRLNFLSVTGNPIQDIPIQNISNLQFLSLAETSLTNQNIFDNEQIWALALDGLALQTINLSGLTGLRWLYAGNGNFMNLDFEAQTNLAFVDISGNPNYITEIDFCSQQEQVLQFVHIDDTTIDSAYLPNIDKVSDNDFLFTKENDAIWLDCQVLNTTDITNSTKIEIFPNPTASYFEYKNYYPILVEIYNFEAKKVLSVANHVKISVENLPNGVYIVRAIDENEKALTHKLIVNKTKSKQL